MSKLKGTIEDLAATFAASIISALRSASIDELGEFTGARKAPAAVERAPAPAPRAPAAVVAAPPAKRGPGRPPKAAAAPAPKASPAPKHTPAPKGAAPKAVAKASPKAASKKSDRLGRRSIADIGRLIDSIVAAVARSPQGLRAEQIRAALGVEAKELPRPLADAVNAGRLTKTGQKRATTYFAGGGKKGKKGR